MVRNPHRIPVLLDALRQRWLQHPDQRFGQLLTEIGYLNTIPSDMYGYSVVGVYDPYYYEDKILAIALGLAREEEAE
jgi:hypothetical protein